jgi:hypothetical protein
MANYKNGKIYKIIGGGNTYIGSTTQKLDTRFRAHKTEKKLRPYKQCASFKILEYEDCKIELIENYPCDNNKQLRERERYWYDLVENINIVRPIRTNDELKDYQKKYNEANKDKLIELNKEYYKNNKEIIKKKVLEYQSKTILCECGCKILRGGLYKHRKTKKHLDNIEKIKSTNNI